LIVSAVLGADMVATLGAGQGEASVPSSTVRSGISLSPGENRMSVITGQVLDAAHRPLAFARVQLRNLNGGAIVSHASTNHVGEFSFLEASPGNFVVEVVHQNTVILAVSEALAVEPGQTVATTIVLPARGPSFAGLFGNSAAAIVSAAAGAGIVAVSAGQPLSPEK
jgi:hypothetical protein